MQVNVLQLGMIGTNCYIFWDEDTMECAVVDPGDSGERVADFIEQKGLLPVAILLTHGHFDHILGIPGLRARWPGLPIRCHRGDVPAERSTEAFGSTFPTVTSFGGVEPYQEGDVVNVGSIAVEVMETPGHTPGSVVLRAGDVLFTGDTLFRGSCGRTDLEGGDARQLMASLKRLALLDGDFHVCPGHEGMSTLSAERRSNYFIAQAMKY